MIFNIMRRLFIVFKVWTSASHLAIGQDWVSAHAINKALQLNSPEKF